MTSPFRKKRSPDDEAKAAQLLRWVEQYEGSGVYTIASRFFEADQDKAIKALAGPRARRSGRSTRRTRTSGTSSTTFGPKRARGKDR